jgi:serine/threonine protein kinase
MRESDTKDSPSGPEEIALPLPQSAVEELQASERIGQLIDGRYRLLSVIGRGGMGTVYKAEHVAIRRIVAVKLLHASLARVPEVSRRFEREAFAIGRIEHPNCVNVSDFGRLPDGSLYLVMEYLEGRALSDELTTKGRLSPARTLHILKHVLRGLGHAHANEIVHRDVKPENVILVEADGDPDFAKILDFGIAKLVGSAAQAGGSERLTQAGMAFGTPIYMSPEQALGQQIDGRADLYAASVMAFEMITGVPPFLSDDKIEVMSMHASRPLPTMAEVAPGLEVPEIVERLLQRGLAKRAHDRFPDAATYIAAIDAVLSEIAPAPAAILMPPPLATGSPPLPAEVLLTPLALTPPPPPHLTATTPPPSYFTATPTPYQSAAMMVPHSTTTPLPYPAAQPHMITGATPQPHVILEMTEPPTLRPRYTARKMIAVVVIITCVIVIVALMSRGRDPVTENTAAPASDAGPAIDAAVEKSIAEQAAALLAKGSPKQAVELLQQHAAEISEVPEAQLQLGHAHAALRFYTAALAAYEKALQLDPSLKSDDRLRAGLETMINADAPVSVDAAAVKYELLGEEEAAAQILASASGGPQNIRHHAVTVAERLGMGDRIDWVSSLILDLEQGETCKARRQFVSRLRALSDPRAIPALREARARRNNACLRKDADEAIQYLESLARDAGTPPKG